MPTGGVTVENLHEWIEAGAVAVGTGGNLTKGAATGDYELVEKKLEDLLKHIEKLKKVNRKHFVRQLT